MKSRARALLNKSIGAMISAIEVYNKPSFRYREETFSVLAINAWELLLKAKWLKEHGNNVKSLYVMAYNSKRGYVALFGGSAQRTRLGDTWTWDGRAWREFADRR